MALYVDFVGLNTLVEEPVDVNTNTVGNFSESRASGSTLLNAGRSPGEPAHAPFATYGPFPDGELRNTSIQTINGEDYLAALNLHRNGPYGYPIFRQLRAGQSPIIRRQRLTNIFSHYEYPGRQFEVSRGEQREVISAKRKPVEHFNEVPVVSRHKPLRMIGSVTTTDEETNKDVLERVEVYTTLGNETTHFSNPKLNKFYNTEEIISEDYENFVDLYLEGGVDGDESPIDEFRLLTYRQVVYPKEIYTYKNHTRNRINFVSRYWRDARSDRTERNVDNGFGFTVMSQSAWVLDAEQDFKDLTFQITPGQYQMRHPKFLRGQGLMALEVSGTTAAATLSQSTETFTWPSSGDGEQEWALSLVGPHDSGLPKLAGASSYTRPIAGLGGAPVINIAPLIQGDLSGDPPTSYGHRKQRISANPWDTSAGMAQALSDDYLTGIKKNFTDKGFNIQQGPNYSTRYARLLKLDRFNTAPPAIEHRTDGDYQTNWRIKTSASTISTWVMPTSNGPEHNPPGGSIPGASSFLPGIESHRQQYYVSGTLFAEDVILPDGSKKVSKLITFDPIGPHGYGSISVKLGTAFTSSHDESIVYIGANEPGAVHYKTTNVYGDNNPIYNAAIAYNTALSTVDNTKNYASWIAALSANHIAVEMNLSGSEPNAGTADPVLAGDLNTAQKWARSMIFQKHHSHHGETPGAGVLFRDPMGYAKIYINGKESALVDTTTYASDEYNFLSGSQGISTHKKQLLNGNSSIKLNVGGISNREGHHLKNESFLSINPFNSNGFSFSYWIRFNSDPTAYTDNENCVFMVRDTDGNAIIDHTIGGATSGVDNLIQVGFQASGGNKRLFQATKNSNFVADTWYNVTFAINKDGSNMTPTLQIYKKGESSPEAITLIDTNGWKNSYASNMTIGEWNTVKTSGELYVFPAGASYSLIRSSATNPHGSFDNVNLDDLAFWNGGLSTYQMNRIVSGSSATVAGDGVGDGQGLTSTDSDYRTRYPGSDESIALQSSFSAPVLRHARRLYEMNTDRSAGIGAGMPTGDPSNVARNFRRGDKILPFGEGTYFDTSDFQTQVIDSDTAGSFDMGFWFKTTHGNWHGRSLEWTTDTGLSNDGNHFKSNISRRQNGGKGFFISFWYKNNHPGGDFTHMDEDYEIIADEDGRWGIYVTSNHASSTASKKQRLAFWLNGEPGTGATGTTTQVKSVFTSITQVPADGQFHFCTVQWNGRPGAESHVAFSIDGELPEVKYEPTQFDTPNLEPVNLLHDDANTHQRSVRLGGTTSYASGYRTTATGNQAKPHHHSITQLMVIEDPPNPWSMKNTIVNYLYNNGNYKGATSYLQTTLLNNLAVDNGTAYFFNPAHPTSRPFPTTTNTSLEHNNVHGGHYPLWKCTRSDDYEWNSGTGTMCAAFRAVNESGWETPTYSSDSNASGWTVSFIFKTDVGGTTYWPDTTNQWTLLQLRDNNGNNVLELYKNETTGTDDLWGLIHHPGGKQSGIRFENVVPLLCNAQPHHVVLTWDGTTNGAGTPRNCNLYIDGVRQVGAHIFHPSNPMVNGNIDDLFTPTSLTIGCDGDGNYSLPGSYWLGAIRMFPNYMGGDSTAAAEHASRGGSIPHDEKPLYQTITDIRSIGNYVGAPASVSPLSTSQRWGAGLDASWWFAMSGSTKNHPTYGSPENLPTNNVSTDRVNIIKDGQYDSEWVYKNVQLLPPVVDCSAGRHCFDNPEWDYSNKTPAVLNRATKTPKWTHWYRLGQEPEVRDGQMFRRVSSAVLNNSASVTGDALNNTSFTLDGDYTELDAGPRHWTIDKYSWNGDVSVEGHWANASRSTIVHEEHQTLFVASDEREVVPGVGGAVFSEKTTTGGIELYLSASGGGYHLCSAISRADTDEIVRSAPNIIVPDRWYHLYASYQGLTSTTTPSVQLYLNGQPLALHGTAGSRVVQAGVGNFDELTAPGGSQIDCPMIGGHVSNSFAGSRRDFSGFIQDIAFWTNNDISRAIQGYLNVWNGMKANSKYIDTSSSKLFIALKTGFLEGTVSAIPRTTRVGGTFTPNAMARTGYNMGTSRAYITGPPIDVYRAKEPLAATTATAPFDEGSTCISFWSSIATPSAWHKIISFNSDERFSVNEYLDYADDGSVDDNYQRTHDTSTTPNDSTFTRLSLSLMKGGFDDNYRLKISQAGLRDEASYINHRGQILRSMAHHTPYSTFEAPAGTLFHNTVFIEKDSWYWYINGVLEDSDGFTGGNAFDDTSFHHRGINGDFPRMNAGWNNITVFNEDETYTTNSKIDEVTVLYYPEVSAINRTTLAQKFYNNGSVYNFAADQDNAYAWWRMGENTSTPLAAGSTLNANQRIDDEGGLANHLTTVFSSRLQAITRTGTDLSDLKNYYQFNATDLRDPMVPAAPGDDSGLFVDPVGSRTLYRQDDSPGGLQATADYSFDSYRLAPLGWLACEAPVSMTIIGGIPEESISDAGSLSHWKPGQSRLRFKHRVQGATWPVSDTKPATIGDFAIFTGVSNVLDPSDTSAPIGDRLIADKTNARTTIKFGANPQAGEKLVIIVNPRDISGGATSKQLNINFTDVDVDTDGVGGALAVDSQFYDIDVGSSPVVVEHHAHINTTLGSPNLAATLTHIKSLLDHTTGMNVDGTSTGWTKTSVGGDTINIVSNTAGGDGKYEVIAKFIGSETQCDIHSVAGASHISKALCMRPSFGWVRQDGSDFSKSENENPFAPGYQAGLLPVLDNGQYVVKPYWYAVETKEDHSSDGTTITGDYETNAGLAGTIGYNLEYVGSVNEAQVIDDLTGYGSKGFRALDSGSVIHNVVNNTPSLDFNKITTHANHYFTTIPMPSYTSPTAPKPLIGGSTGARSRFGPGVLQNSYNQFTQEVKQSPTQTIDAQLSASACYFRRHTLTASTSFVSPTSGFLQKLSASHNAENTSTFLCGNMSASHLFLGSAKWEAGDFAGYYNEEGTFVFKPKKPFFDNYGAFIEEARPLMKDYGIVPEFKISEHVNSYLTKGATEQKLNFLNITGGLESADMSNKKDFFKIYSTTDFLKHFELVQEDHSDFVDPFAIRLRCSVVKKFLPYEGFYPAQRTVQVAEQFYKSYGDNINITASQEFIYDLTKEKNYGAQYLLNPLFSPGIMYNTIKSGVAVDYPLVTDTGSVLAIRYTDDGTDSGAIINGGAMIRNQFDTRIPFEALLEPEKHLANITLASNEPDESGKTDIEIEWGGQGDQLYNLMVSNFLAETSEFFLENKSFTSLASLSQGDPNFGNAQAGNIYMMRLKMFRTTEGQKLIQRNRLSKSYGVPQDGGSMTEAFTMYSRPSAFGPPQYLSGSEYTANTWADFKFDGTSGSMFVTDAQSPVYDLKALPFQHDFSYVTGTIYGQPYGASSTASGAIGNEAQKGYNYPFTPPYYHGEAWADITFIPTETKKYSLQEIINQSSVEFYRYYAGVGTLSGDGFTPTTTPVGNRLMGDDDGLGGYEGQAVSTLSYVHDRTVVINDQAMQIASSVNIFSQGVLEQDISAQGATGIGSTTNVQVDTDIANKYRWIIQTKFETPILNFNKYTYGKHTNDDARQRIVSSPGGNNASMAIGGAYAGLELYQDNTYGIELPGVGPMQTPVGMWHQYGHIPQNSKEGIFLQVDDVPKSWIRNAMYRPPRLAKRYRSLATLCGFSTDPVRMGEIAGVKEISEAVVAIPFFEKAGRRRFFAMNRRQIKLALDPSKKNLVGRTVVDMVEKMQKFILPPSLDFVSNDKIKPFSMYIFEFNHNLTKQDLADIWQNLPPELNQTVETDEVTISHQLLAYELLGPGGRYRRGRDSEVELVRNDRAESVNPEIQWMVFKVKQKAKTNYFEKIFARNESQQLLSQRLKLGVSADALGRKKKVSYNWPYDFFSMIEGVKLNAEVHFLDYDEEASQAQEKPVIKPKTKDTKKNREKRTAASRRLLGAVSGKVPPDKLKKSQEEVDKKPKRKKGKITRKRRVKMTVKKPNTQKKKLNNAFDRKKLK